MGHCNSDRCTDSWYGKDDCWCECATCTLPAPVVHLDRSRLIGDMIAMLRAIVEEGLTDLDTEHRIVKLLRNHGVEI